VSRVLIDTSVWISHLRSPNGTLIDLLKQGVAATHSAVIGELACGSIKNRVAFVESLGRLKFITEAESKEVIELIERRKLYGKGIGWIDAQLLASCLISDATLFTLDKKLAVISSKLLP